MPQAQAGMRLTCGLELRSFAGSAPLRGDILSSPGQARVMECLTACHSCCIFYKSKAGPCPSKAITTCFFVTPTPSFIVVVWNQTCGISEVCLWLVFCSWDSFSLKEQLRNFVRNERSEPVTSRKTTDGICFQ